MPRAGSEANPINSVYFHPETKDEPGALTLSGVAQDGFDLSWNLTAHSVYDSFAVEFTDIQLWDVREVPLPGDTTGTSIRGLKALRGKSDQT